MKAICVKCKFVLVGIPNGIWYNYNCVANPVSKEFDFVTGKYKALPLSHCRDINTNGKCKDFKPKR